MERDCERRAHRPQRTGRRAGPEILKMKNEESSPLVILNGAKDLSNHAAHISCGIQMFRFAQHDRTGGDSSFFVLHSSFPKVLHFPQAFQRFGVSAEMKEEGGQGAAVFVAAGRAASRFFVVSLPP